MKLLTLLSFLLAFSSVHAASKPAPLVWTLVGPQGSFSVRSLTYDEKCPDLRVDGQKIEMKWRSPTSQEGFPLRVCESPLPPGAQKAQLNGEVLAVPVSRPKRIAVLGDTGCRIKKLLGITETQNCNDPAAWPFAKIAQAAASWNPDLVIHVGDYHYRESECPPSQPQCQGAVPGDQWESWAQDFFVPAKPLLKAAPWLFVRGNHESCARAGRGWFLLLDPRPAGEACVDKTPPYRVQWGGLSLAVVDSAEHENTLASLSALAKSPQTGEWLVTHRPFLAPRQEHGIGETQVTLPRGMRGDQNLGWVMAGHVHLGMISQFTDTRPPELVVGNSGTKMLSPRKSFVHADSKATVVNEFGFATLEWQSDSHWIVSERNEAGVEIVQCDLKLNPGKKSQIQCREAKR